MCGLKFLSLSSRRGNGRELLTRGRMVRLDRPRQGVFVVDLLEDEDLRYGENVGDVVCNFHESLFSKNLSRRSNVQRFPG